MGIVSGGRGEVKKAGQAYNLGIEEGKVNRA